MRDTAGLVATLPGARVAGTLPRSVDAIATDSRAVKPGTLFIALRGERTDGHAYVNDAIARGATVIVIEEAAAPSVTQSASVTLTLRQAQGKGAPPTVTVADTRVAASALADAFYDHPSRDLTVVGVTGTNGKTTTTHLIRDVLEAGGMPCGIVGTLGGSFGTQTWPLSNTTPLALELHAVLAAQRDAGAKAVAMEVSSHALALHRVDHVSFDIAVLTNITRDHLDFHGTMDRYVAAKRRIFDLAARAVVNEDDPTGARLAAEISARGGAMLSYSIDGESKRPEHASHGGVRATDVRLAGDGSTFRVGDTDFVVNLPGRFNVRNALAAIGVGTLLGIDGATIARGLATTRAVPGRMERIGAFGIDAIVDYAHTPDALENVLNAARETTRGDLIVVFGCGGDRDPGKRTQMGEIAARIADRVIVTSDNPRSEDPLSIARSVANGYDRTDIELDRRDAIRRAIDEAKAGDTVVVAGKGHETYQIVGDQSRPFDDRDEVRIAFSKRGRR